MANDSPSIPGLDDPISVAERSAETGVPEYMIVERIESGVIDGVKHDGTWYVERQPRAQRRAQASAGLDVSAAPPNASSPAGDAPDPPQAPRPLSLSIIGWWLTVSGVLSVLGLTAASNPAVRSTWESMGIDPTLAVISSLVTGVAHAVAGAGILQGWSWARTFYLWFGAASLIAGVFLFSSGLPAFLLSASVYAIAVYFLTRDAARAYLEDDYEISPESARRRRALATVRTSQRNPSDLKRVFGVLFATGAGGLLTMAVFVIGFAPGLIAVVLAGFFGVPALIALVFGVVLWGRSRWASVSGWTLLGTGVLTVTSGLSLLSSLQTKAWKAAMAQAEMPMEVSPAALISMCVIGGLVGLSGAGLLLLQRAKDHDAARDHLDPEEAA